MLTTAIMTYAQTISINYNGTTADVTIPEEATGVTATVDGAHVSITSLNTATEFTYRLTGATTDGSFSLVGGYKLTIELAGVDITSNRGAAIDIQTGKRVAVVLVPETENTLIDAEGGTQKAAFYFTGHPEFQGSGTLNVTGRTAHAISAKEYIQFKKNTGIVNILGAVKDGINCGKAKVAAFDENVFSDLPDIEPLNQNEYFFFNGGILNISNTQGDCIDSGDYGCMLIKGGTLNLQVTAPDVCALKSANTFIMTDGDINIELYGALSDGIYVNREARLLGGTVNIYAPADGTKGIKGKIKATSPYTTGGNIIIDGTTANIIAAGADDATDPLDPSHCVGISTDGNLSIADPEAVCITAVGSEARAYTCDGELTGSATVITTQWYVNPYLYEHSMTLYAVLDGADYSNTDIAAFVGDECRGVLQYNAQGYGYLRIYSNEASGETITFRAYDRTTGTMLNILDTVTFQSMTTVGLPSSPLHFNLDATIPGDLNSDGIVTVADVVILVDYILGNRTIDTNKADLNHDGTINQDDVDILVGMVVEKVTK